MSGIEIPTGTPCPRWCGKGHGHPYGPDGPRQMVRGHSGFIGHSDELGLQVEIYALEVIDVAGATLHPSTISVLLTDDAERTPEELRGMAAVLLSAAEAADKLQGVPQ